MTNNTNEWNDKIMQKISEIQQKHPELMQILNEMLITIPNKNNTEINSKKLKKYYRSLCALIESKE